MNGTSDALLAAVGISKAYGQVLALDGVDFAVQRGEVVGLVGDNGAGKSTLLKIITGFIRPSSGSLVFDGSPCSFASPADARRVGIETVYQNLALVDDMSLWRNFFLGKETVSGFGRLGILRATQMRATTMQELRAIGLTRIATADESARVLSGGERQALAITRAVHFGAKMLLLDEPTASLAVRETRQVFASIDVARRRGLGVIYVDHNMSHVYPIADRITVLRHGRVLASLRRDQTSVASLTDLLSEEVRQATGEGHV